MSDEEKMEMLRSERLHIVDENRALLAGEDIPVLLIDDHDLHVREHSRFKGQSVDKHIREHLKFMKKGDLN